MFADRSPVKPAQFRALLKALMKKCKLKSSDYSCCHRMRAGRVTDLLEMGVPVETIRKLGRWKSTAVYTYLRL